MDKQYMDEVQRELVHTYEPFPVVMDHGEGMYLYDTEGKKYLDFAAGYAVTSLGYGNQEWEDALKEQMDKLCHISNLYYHTKTKEAAKAVKRITGMDRVFFTNSGGEAIEGALKAARKYAYTRKNGRYEFIAMQSSFHGRSFGAVSITGHEAYRMPFEPLFPGVKFAEFNDLKSVRSLVTEQTCAIIVEPIQGEGGINVASKEFLQGIRSICTEQDILMICDEIQCGMGRSGSMFAYQQAEVKPDIVTMAKAIGNGFPVGAFAMTEKTAQYSLEPGDHGTTYGGNPLACTAVAKTIEIFERENLAKHAEQMGLYLSEKLEELVHTKKTVKKRKGKGLMQGIEVSISSAKIAEEALKKGLLLIGAGKQVVRFVPPLIVTEKEIDEMVSVLNEILE